MCASFVKQKGNSVCERMIAMPPPAIPFGKFELVSRLAAGGMAEIFLARTRSVEGFEKYLVIKKILQQRTNDPEFVTMLLDEARLAASLDHPNIVKIYDVGQFENEYFISMEYLRGHNLIEIIRAGAHVGYSKPPLEHVVSAFTQAFAGLHYAHEKRDLDGRSLDVVHRDFTPQNIVVSFDGTVKVVDFGIAKAASRGAQTVAGTLKGKLGYMSPEQCSGGDVDRRTDIFAAGVMLYELTTGKRLYHERSDFETLKKIVEGPVPSPRELLPFYPAFLDEIVVRCLQKKPEHRYQTVRDLHHDLDAFARDGALVVGTVPLAQYMERIFAEELTRRRSSDASGIIPLATQAGSTTTSSYLGEASRRSSAPVATPRQRQRRQRVVRLALQGIGSVLLLLLGGGVTAWLRAHRPVAPSTMVAAVGSPIASPLGSAAGPKPTAASATATRTAAGSTAAANSRPDLARRPRVAAPLDSAHLTIASEPRCEVLVDGVPYGLTPLIDLALPSGKHSVTLLNSAADIRETRRIVLRDGELWTRSFSFDGKKAVERNGLAATMLNAVASSAPTAPSSDGAGPARAPAPTAATPATAGQRGASAVAARPMPSKPKNVDARTLDGQQVSHVDPHLPEIVRIQRKGTGDASFAAKVCVNNDGRVYAVDVLRTIPGADAAVVDAIRSWTYQPQPISVCFIANIVFDLQ